MTTDEKLIRNKLGLLELELVSVLASFVRHLKLYPPDGDSESPEYLKEERILTELWIFRQSSSGACFYRKSIFLARLLAQYFILKY